MDLVEPDFLKMPPNVCIIPALLEEVWEQVGEEFELVVSSELVEYPCSVYGKIFSSNLALKCFEQSWQVSGPN